MLNAWPGGVPTTYDLFLVFPAAAVRLGDLRNVALGALARLVGVDLYYRADTDLALLSLRLDPRTVTASFLERLRDEAENAGAAVLEPARLATDERSRFYGAHLAGYPFKATDFPTIADAVRKLAIDLGIEGEPSSAAAHGPGRIEVRLRRGESWLLGRARSLTREGIYVYSGCALRVGDVVELQLTTGGAAASLGAVVVHVTPEDAALTVGGPGFGARFLLASNEERQRLEALVVSGRAEGLGTLRAAPRRREARYPVRWPVALDTSVGAAFVSALDVSLRGMFVAMNPSLASKRVEIQFPNDDLTSPIRARGRVARTMTDPVAQARGVVPGYGLEIHDFSPGDDERFRGFVHRVGRRATRHVLVGAGHSELRRLVTPLVAAGYVAAGCSDANELARRAVLSRTDLVLIDASLVPGDPAARALHHKLAARKTLAYRLDPAQDDRSVRSLADAALLS